MSTPQQLTALAEHRLDLAFGWTPDLTEDFDALLVTRDPLVLAVAEDHPLAALQAVPPGELSRWPVVIAPRAVNSQLYARTVSQLVAAGAIFKVHQEIAGLDRMLPLVLARAAVAITCATSAAANLAAGVKYRPFTDPIPWVDHTLVWRANDRSPAVRSLLRWCVISARQACSYRLKLSSLLSGRGRWWGITFRLQRSAPSGATPLAVPAQDKPTQTPRRSFAYRGGCESRWMAPTSTTPCHAL